MRSREFQAWAYDVAYRPVGRIYLGYSPLDVIAFIYASEDTVAARSKQLSMVLPGPKGAKETAYFVKNARALAQMAKERTSPGCPVGAVFFRDSDGTRSMGNSLWRDKWASIERGFAIESFTLGVPMLPKPKSEAWLLCAVQQNPYTNCSRFENISGNDASPNSAKRQLDEALAAIGKDYTDMCDLIDEGLVGATRIEMPSYNRFRERLETVAHAMAGHPPV